MIYSDIKNLITGERKEYFNNVFNLQFSQIIAITANLIFTAILVRAVSVDQYGRYIFFLAIVEFLSFLNLPGMNIVIRKGVLKNYDKIYDEYIRLVLKITFIFCLILAPLIIGLKFFVLGDNLVINQEFYNTISSFDWDLALVAIIFLLPSSFSKFETFLISKEKFSLIRNIKIIDSLLKIILVGGSAYLYSNIIIVILFFIIHSIIIIIIGNYFVYKHKESSSNSLFDNRKLLREGLKYSFIDIVGFTAKLDKVILGSIDPGLLALYHIGQRFPQLIKDHMKHFITPILLKWGRLNRSVHIEKIKNNFMYFIITGVVLAVSIALASKTFIPIIFGEQYNRCIYIAYLLCIPIMSQPISTAILDFDTVQDNGKKYTILMSVLPIIYTVLIIILIPKFKLMGIISSSIILNITACIAMLVIIMKGDYSKK